MRKVAVKELGILYQPHTPAGAGASGSIPDTSVLLVLYERR